MRAACLFFLAVLGLAATVARAGEAVVPSADGRAIRAVIEQQIAAFGRDDAAAAFAFASPAIQHRFGSPEAFMAMVRTAYEPVYHPRAVSFRATALVQDMIVQEVALEEPDGNTVKALYVMEKEPDGSWRVNGCFLAAGDETPA